jgi:hypothetical protein
MEWLAGIVIGFVAILTVVVVLARRSTERWEKEKRVALRPRVRLAGTRASRRSRPGAVVRPARVSRRGRQRADRASTPVSDAEDPEGLR